MIVVDGDHDVTILDTSDGGQDVPILIENNVAPRTRLGLRGSCRNRARELDDDQGTYVSHDAGANRDFSCERTVPIGGSAWAIRPSINAFRQFRRFTLYGTATYQFSLRDHNDTYSLGAALNPAGPEAVREDLRYVSTPDSYLGNLGVGVPLGFALIAVVSLLTPPPGPRALEMVDRIRLPD